MTGSERGTVTRALATGRNHVLSQLHGLTEDQLRAPVAPSGKIGVLSNTLWLRSEHDLVLVETAWPN